jgi:DHA3 family macrolide efflux protein-like MFS transporter
MKELWDLICQRNYGAVLASNGLSRFADSLDSLVFAWLVYQLTGSTLLMGTILAVNALPNVLLAPVAGVLADRWRKLPLMRTGALGRSLLAGLVATLVISGQLQVWHLFVVTVLSSTLETLASPTQSALAVHLVDKPQLAAASGLSQTVATAAQLAGLAFVAVGLGPLGLGGLLVLDAGLFALAAGVLFVPRLPSDVTSVVKLSGSRWNLDLQEGWRFLRSDRLLLGVVLLALFLNLAFSPLSVLEAPFVKDVLHAGAETLAGVGLSLLIGMVVAGLFVGAAVSRWGTWTTMLGGLVGLGVSFAAVGLVGWLPAEAPRAALAMALYATAGLALPFVNAPIGAWFSAAVAPELQGRVFSTINALSLVATPLGAAASGALAQVWSVPALFVATGVLVLVATVVAKVALFPVERPAQA